MPVFSTFDVIIGVAQCGIVFRSNTGETEIREFKEKDEIDIIIEENSCSNAHVC